MLACDPPITEKLITIMRGFTVSVSSINEELLTIRGLLSFLKLPSLLTTILQFKMRLEVLFVAFPFTDLALAVAEHFRQIYPLHLAPPPPFLLHG